jgi:hypothetical protein
MDLCGADSLHFGVTALKTNSGGGMRLNAIADDDPHYNLLGNRTVGIVLGEPALR